MSIEQDVEKAEAATAAADKEATRRQLKVDTIVRLAVAFKAFWLHERKSPEEKRAVRTFAELLIDLPDTMDD